MTSRRATRGGGGGLGDGGDSGAAAPGGAPEPVPVARRLWLDTSRGAGIVLVVAGHVWRGMEVSGLIPPRFDFQMVDRAIYLFHMPLFFVLAGLSLSGLGFAGGNKPEAGRFLAGRAARLLWPLTLWTYLFIALQAAAQGASHAPVEYVHLLRTPLPPYAHLWFLWALFLLQLGGYALLRAPLGRAGRGAALIALGLLPLIGFNEAPPGWQPYLQPALSYLPAFALGLLAGEAALRAPAPGLRAGLAGLGTLAACILVDQTADPTEPAHLALGVVAAVGALVALRALAGASGGPGRLAAGLAGLGGASMAIYLAHVVFTSGTRAALLALGVRDFGPHLGLGIGAGLAGSLAALALTRRLRLTRALGF